MHLIKYLLIYSSVFLLGCNNNIVNNDVSVNSIIGRWVMIQENKIQFLKHESFTETKNLYPSDNDYYDATIFEVLPNYVHIEHKNSYGTEWNADTGDIAIINNMLIEIDFDDNDSTLTYDTLNISLNWDTLTITKFDGDTSDINSGYVIYTTVYIPYSGIFPPLNWTSLGL